MLPGRLPNLLVVGVPKAGTGSLFAYLTQHPEICGADEKEVGYFNFFDPRRGQGAPPPLEEYARHFCDCGNERYAMEATPTYSYGGRPVIEAIRSRLGSPRIVVSLRNPADRLWSAYTFQRELGNLSAFTGFDDYLEECLRRRRDGSHPVPRDHMHGLHIGFYAEYLPQWLDEFGDDVRVVFAERLAADPVAEVGALFRWLGLDGSVTSGLDLARRNVTQHPRSVRAARIAYSVKRTGDRLGLVPPGVRQPLRRLYQWTNSGQLTERMDPAARLRVEEVYASSNSAVAERLSARGYRELPDWLASPSIVDRRGPSRDHSAHQRDAPELRKGLPEPQGASADGQHGE